MSSKYYFVEGIINEGQIKKYLVPLREAQEEFQMTAYVPPNRFGPINSFKQKYPWITFGILGWENTPYECLNWTVEQAENHITQALKMGYEALFKPPTWHFDDDLEEALKSTSVVLHYKAEICDSNDDISINRFKSDISYQYFSHVYENLERNHIRDNPFFAAKYLKGGRADYSNPLWGNK